MAVYLTVEQTRAFCGNLATLPVARDARRHAQQASGGLFSIADALIYAERVDDCRPLFVPDGCKDAATPPAFLVKRLMTDDAALSVDFMAP